MNVRILMHWNHASMRDFAVHVFKLNRRVMDVETLRKLTANRPENSVAF